MEPRHTTAPLIRPHFNGPTLVVLTRFHCSAQLVQKKSSLTVSVIPDGFNIIVSHFFLHKFVKLVLLFWIALFHLYIQLWDLTSGKLLHEFKQHTAAVNCVEFHPKEFLLATASNDRFVTFVSFLSLSLQATWWIKCPFVHNRVQLGFLTGNCFCFQDFFIDQEYCLNFTRTGRTLQPIFFFFQDSKILGFGNISACFYYRCRNQWY